MMSLTFGLFTQVRGSGPSCFFKVGLALLLQYTGMCGLAEYRNDIEMAPKSITEVIH